MGGVVAFSLSLLLLSAVSFCSVHSAHTYYVSPSGSDSNTGTSTSSPFRTIQHAADIVGAGDTVYVMSGTYTTTSTKCSSCVGIYASGTPNSYITFSAYSGATPKVVCACNQQAFQVWNNSYIVINGFELEGSYVAGQNDNSSGIFIGGWCHHINITNNIVHDFPGGGIETVNVDYSNIQGNKVYSNSKYSPYQTSGISLYQNINSDNLPGYHNIIRDNVVYNNYILVNGPDGIITDGNGIIIDDSRNTQNKSPYGVYKGKTLIENNVCVGNGGRGIHVFTSDNVDIFNNVAYRNQQTPIITDGELSMANASNVNLINNIAVPNYGGAANGVDSTCRKVKFSYNLYYNTTNIQVDGPTDVVGHDPLFLSASLTATFTSFEIKAGSPAIGKGTNTGLPGDKDILGVSRPSPNGWDIGAYVFVASATPPPTPKPKLA